MKKIIWCLSFALVMTCIVAASPLAWAKHADGNPPGWEHGKKTGWHGGDKPPGFEKKEHHHKKHHKKHHEGEKEEEKKEGAANPNS